MRARRSRLRLSTARESPSKLSPPGRWMSQNMRATAFCWGRQGRTAKVLGSGEGAHVAFVGAGVALDGGAVEADALIDGIAQVGGVDGKSLQISEDVGKPEANELYIDVFRRLQDIVSRV